MRISSAKFLVASSVLTIAISCGSAYAFAENDPAASGPRTEVNIGAEPLEEALNKLAQQFGKQIVFFSDATAGLVSTPLEGRYTDKEALDLLLEGTALEYRYLNDRTISVSASDKVSDASVSGNTAMVAGTQLASLDTSVPDRQANSGVANFEDDDTSGALEVINVTAQKRVQSLQDVPLSITAFSGETLDRQGLVSLREIARFTPGFASSTFSESEPIFAVRGANNTFSQAGASKPVGVFLDDVFISRNTASAFELYDLEQVAVLRGPQGTLFGRNVTGGAITIRTARPSLEETRFKAQVGYGNFDAVELRGLASGPLGDQVAAKISATYRTRDGYGRDRLADREQNDLETFNVRGQLLFAPSATVEALLTFDYSEDQNNGRTLTTTSPAGADDGDIRTSEHGIGQFYDRETFGITLHLDWELDAGSLTSITAYRESDSIENFAFSATAFQFIPSFNPFFPFQQNGLNSEEPETFSEELRWVSADDGPINYVVGLYYFSEDISRQANSIRLRGATGETIRNQTFDQSADTESFAIYTDVEIAASETLKINLGGRYTWEEKKAQLDFINSLNPSADFQSPTFEESWNAFNPRAVLTWQPSDDVSLYGSFTEGFTSGGFNTEEDTEAVVGTPFDPENIRAYEIGAKTELLDRKLRANIALFRQDYKNKQEGFLDPTFNFVIANAAKARMKGIEIELHWALNEFFTLHGSYSYLDAVYKEFLLPPNNAAPDRSGNFLPTSPKNSFAVGGDFRHPLGDVGYVFANVSYARQGNYFTGSENRDTFLIDSYDLVDASVGFEAEDGGWRVILWGKNLADEEYVLIRSDFGPGGIGEHFGAPRTYGLRASASF